MEDRYTKCEDRDIQVHRTRTNTDLCIPILCFRMHTLHMRCQLILPMKSSPTRILTTSTVRDMAPEVRLDCGV